MLKNQPIVPDRTDLIVARHSRLNGRSHLPPRYQHGGPLAHTLAFESDSMTDEVFQERVLSGVQSLDAQIREGSKKYQKLEEDFLKIKRVANDQQANATAFIRQVKRLEDQMRLEKRHAFGDPVSRIQDDDELRARFNIAIRLACSKTTELVSRRLADRAKEITGFDIDEVARDVRAKSIKDVVGRALGEDSSPGSTLIDDRLAREIYDTLALFGIWNTFQVDPVGAQTMKYPVTTARPTANFILTEASTISDGSITGTSVSNVMEVIAVLLNVSLQVLEDSEFDVTSYVLDLFAEAYAERLDHACLNAAGAADATDGGMTGVFQGGTAATADAGAGADDTVEELEFEDWTRCLLTVDPVVLQRQAKWWLHPQILVRALSIKDGNGRPIFLTALEAPAASSIGTILGYPVVPAFKAPNTNSASQKVAVFGDPRGLVVGMRRSYTFEASDHARWTTLERSFRGWGRAGTKIRRALAFAVLTLGA